MFDSTFFKFLVVFIAIIGLSSVIITFVGGMDSRSTIDSKTAQFTD